MWLAYSKSLSYLVKTFYGKSDSGIALIHLSHFSLYLMDFRNEIKKKSLSAFSVKSHSYYYTLHDSNVCLSCHYIYDYTW